jgi:ankyrin repeat protein
MNKGILVVLLFLLQPFAYGVKHNKKRRHDRKIQNALEKKNSAGFTPLHLACLYGNKKTVKSLLKYGANPNTTSHDGGTPLIHSLNPKIIPKKSNGQVDIKILKLLIKSGAKIDYTTGKWRNNAFNLAAKYCSNKVVKVLLNTIRHRKTN